MEEMIVCFQINISKVSIFMPKTDIKIEDPPTNIDKLIEVVEKELEKENYHFLKIAFDQQLIFCDSDVEKYSLIKDYVSLGKS